MTPENLLPFALGGHAVFTVSNERTGGRFTYRVKRARPKRNCPLGWFVSVLSGPDNEHDYRYVGFVSEDDSAFRPAIDVEAKSVKAFGWLWRRALDARPLPPTVRVVHSGRCSKCGRTLTTPESIERGIGPSCAEKMAS